MDVKLNLKRDETFELDGVKWTIQEVYRTNKGPHSFNAIAFIGYYVMQTFILEPSSEQRQPAQFKKAA